MLPLAPAEHNIWARTPKQPRINPSDADINEKYDQKEHRIVTESNREKLPNFVAALKRTDYMNVRPFYQRRPRWDETRQSKLIESFIINIPVPPLFVYETKYNSYEIMDGQQRITAIRNFYENDLALRGLDIWPELNGRKYSTLPERIRAGIDRRSISYIVLLKESAETDEEALLLKQLVFGRLNTGGVALTQQELRNSLYQGPFNELLFELAAFQRFREAWGLPRPTENERVSPPAELLRNTFFVKMEDVELVLRFFALRHVSHYQRGMQGFLNLYMIRAQAFEPVDLAFLRSEFISTMTTAAEIFGDLVFRPFDVKKGEWATRPQKAFYDAVMVGLSRNAEHFDLLRRRREQVIDGTRHLFINNEEGTFTGRGNSKSDIETRIGLFSTMLQLIVQA